MVLDMLPLLDTRRKEQDITASFVADLVLQVLCYVCEKERLLNKERAAAGIAAAKARDQCPFTRTFPLFVSCGRKKKSRQTRPQSDWE